ncbi:MAG: hypothetical protein JXR58_06225 [Bacteroidales bacterium]|nr:hypothetical protein [Bacteroidales bacterium]
MTNTKIIAALLALNMLFSCSSSNRENGSEKSQEDTIPSQKLEADFLAGNKFDFTVKDLFKNENSDIVNPIAVEDFELALKKIDHYWTKDSTALTETQKASMRYMKIYAFAGLVYQGKKTHEEMKNLVESFENQFLITQHLEITEGNDMPFNQIQVEQENDSIIGISCANNDGVNIHCFVNVSIGNYDLLPNVGKRAYLGGKLSSFEVSDDEVFSWIIGLKLTEGFIKFLEDEFEHVE